MRYVQLGYLFIYVGHMKILACFYVNPYAGERQEVKVWI